MTAKRKVHILLAGLVGLYVLIFELAFSEFAPALLAITIVGLVIAGFCLRPGQDSWTVWVSHYQLIEGNDADWDLVGGKQLVRVKADSCKLSVLFVPTVAAVGLLVLFAARGAWRLDWFDKAYYIFPYGGPLVWVAIWMWFLLSSWISERWLLQRAQATEVVRHFGRTNGGYYFQVDGEYFGGHPGGRVMGIAAVLSQTRDRALWDVVMFRSKNPSFNRCIPNFFFHRFEVVASGLPDLENTRAAGTELQRINLAAQE